MNKRGKFCKECLEADPGMNSEGHSPYIENDIVPKEQCECIHHENVDG